MGNRSSTAPYLGIRVRPANPRDLPQLVWLLERCSSETLYWRFHGAAGYAVRRELTRIATPTTLHRSWVAATDEGVVHGTATLAWGADRRPEVAFLVEDDWFRRGVGRALFMALTSEARQSDAASVGASIQPDNRRAVRFLTAVAPSARMAFVDGLLEVTIPVRRRSTWSPAVVGAGVGLGGSA